MSKESWLAEYYPKDATEIEAKDAIAFSLNKWKGLRKENLEKHELEKAPIPVNSSTCPLCNLYEKSRTCPFFKIHSKESLKELHGESPEDCVACDQEWKHWFWKKDPDPMIEALEELEK
jgi:hypothetical protein